MFKCSLDLVKDDRVMFVSDELPGHDKVVFVLDKDQSFTLINAEDFRVLICEMLGISCHQLILVRIRPGSNHYSCLDPQKVSACLDQCTSVP